MATLVPGEQARMYALGKIMRGGASRGGYVDNRLYITIGGNQIGWDSVNPDVGVLLDTLTITDALDEAPNTCSFRVNGWAPPEGSPVRLTRGSLNATAPLFAGYALTVQQFYAGVPRNVQGDVRCVDYTWLLGMRKVTGQYRNQSATAIIQDLVARGAGVNGITTNAVVPGLPILDEITFTDEELPAAITRVCRRIGAYWKIDYTKDVHAFFEDPRAAPPEPLTPTHKSLAHVSALRERTQALTRVLVEGRGSHVVGPVLAGSTTLPLNSVDMFTAAADVFLKVSAQGADSALHLAFTGVVPSRGGSLVGPGIGPSASPTLALQPGTGVNPGSHDYAVTFTTAAGESLTGPRATIASGPVADASVAPYNLIAGQNMTFQGNTIAIGEVLQFAYLYGVNASWPFTANVTMPSLVSAPVTTLPNNDPYNPTNSGPISMQFPNSPDPRVTQILIYMYAQGVWRYVASVTNQPTSTYPNNLQLRGSDYGSASGVYPPPANTTAQGQVAISAIPIGAAAVTGRKLYRTAANQAQLKLLTTIANNTATTYTDTAADTALGVNAPVGDTSGIQQPPGQVIAGATLIPVAGTAPFDTAGGWAVIGNGEQVVKYQGLGLFVGQSALIGIPESGVGAITATVSYNSTVTAAALLTGIPAAGEARALPINLSAGDEVYAVVQVDDTGRQTQLATELSIADGVREEWIQDRRLSIPEARARGRATLQSRPITDWSVEYTCRDTRTASGQTLTVDLPAPTSIQGVFKIQQVVWSNFRPRPEQPPTARVTAANRRFSFEDLLRIVKTKE